LQEGSGSRLRSKLMPLIAACQSNQGSHPALQ